MEVPNKKTMVSIFAGCVFLQMVCILALSANFLLAQTNSDGIYNDSGDSSTYSDDYYYNDTTVNPDVDHTTDTANDNIYNDSGDTTTPETFNSTTDDTDNTMDDTDGTTTDPLILTFIERFESPLFGDRQISISSTQEIYSCIFKIYGPRCAEFSAIKDGPAKYHIMLRTKDFPNGDYTIKVVAGNNIGTAEVRLDTRIENYAETEQDQPPTIEPAPDEPIPTEPISDEPVLRDPFYPTEPVKPIPVEPTPADYSDQPIPDSSTEPYYPEPISTRPEQPIIKITPECLERGLSAEECLKYNQLPDDCRNAGISNSEACKKYMFEKYNSVENIPQDKFPIECQKANAKTADECDKIMRNIYLPRECKEQGIDDEEKCDLYLRQKHLPEECREAGAQSRDECDKIMFKKFGYPECQEAGIEDEEECQEFMFNKYAPRVECNNLEEWQCNNFIRDRHLGNIVAKQTVFSELKENVAHLAGKTITSEELKEKIGESANIIPVKEEVKFKIILGEEKLTLNEEDNLVQTAPIILMIDSDMDGLPDDLEKRLGTDPDKADTDKDGYDDGEEVKNGRNPLGRGELESEVSPIDEAILQNKTLEHPKTGGKETKNITIENITNLENKQTGAVEGYALSGKSEPNSVVALYIYSDLPLVITTKTDKYGNWQYKLSEPLTDGEHEIYVAINDNTGKVVSKSKPLHFFVKEAQAISVKDFISPTASAASEIEKESDSSIYYYLIAAFSLIIIGILFFVAMIMKKKKRVVN